MLDEHNAKENDPPLEQGLDWGLGRGRAREGDTGEAKSKASKIIPLDMN